MAKPKSKSASTKAPVGRASHPKRGEVKGAAAKSAAAPAVEGHRQRRSDDADAFIPDPSDGPAHSNDDLAEVLAEDFLESATRGNDVFEDERARPLSDEIGGPFVVTDADEELADDVDASNPVDAEPSGRPRAVAGLVQRPRAEELSDDTDDDDDEESEDEDDTDEVVVVDPAPHGPSPEVMRSLGLRFVDLASPRWFAEDPELAWGFYGHRLNLYRATPPHRGFATLLAWARRMARGAFVFTSNVDGHFQRAGFDPLRIVECHGAIETNQCSTPCGPALFPSATSVTVDAERFRAARPLPSCPRCGALARPNILMFGDDGWIGRRTDEQHERLAAWLEETRGPVVVLELGAGTAVPTVRLASETIARRTGGTLVRVNPREPEVPPGAIGLAMGALEALDSLARA